MGLGCLSVEALSRSLNLFHKKLDTSIKTPKKVARNWPKNGQKFCPSGRNVFETICFNALKSSAKLDS
jgi:hypothetical protein